MSHLYPIPPPGGWSKEAMKEFDKNARLALIVGGIFILGIIGGTLALTLL